MGFSELQGLLQGGEESGVKGKMRRIWQCQ
jgi:hypothetical protein